MASGLREGRPSLKGRPSLGEMFALIGEPLPEEAAGRPFPAHVATDSRCVEPGGAFVALEGERVDGHRYVPQALERGAGLIVVRRGKRPDGLPVPCVELEEPERDLARLASAYLSSLEVPEVVAITGSVGKTTTRAALQRVLGGRFRLHAAARSLNTRIGCACTVLAMPPDAEVLLLEFGANKPGEILELTNLFPPTSAAITQVAPVHLEGFGSLEGVLRGKMEIVRSPRLRHLLYNFDCLPLRNAALSMGGKAETLSIGSDGADCRIEAPRFEMRGNRPELTFRLRSRDGATARFSAGVWGTHLALPLAFAAAFGELEGIGLAECAEVLRGFQPLDGRGRILSLDGGRRFLVDDAYNANPESMRASLATFVELQVEGKMAILGEMREMGRETLRYHRELEPLLNGLQSVVLVGEAWRSAVPERPGLAFVRDWREALEIAEGTSWTGLLVKGSNSLGLQNVVRGLVAERGGATS